MRQLDAQGCERPALVTVLGFARWRGFDEDLQAYRRALRGRPECIWEHLPDATGDVRESTAQHWREQGEESVAALFASASPPDGLVVTDDMMCLGVLAGLRRLGLVPGRDVHIATHASRGADAMRGQEDLVARLEIDPAGIVEAMFQLLESQMAGDGAPAGAILVKPTLIAPPQEAMEPVGGATHCDASRTDVSILPAGSRVAQSVNTIKEPSTP
jgi:DNA-binding LacI/PurR family transcriptional regulator